MDFEKLLEEAAGKKLAGKKKQLQSSYDQSLADLAELEQGAAQQAREAATRRTVEAKQDRAAWNEIQTAQGLTSGAQSQALLAMDNQLRGDLTAIANTRDSATAELARKRQALARDLAQQLEQAQLESDYEQIMERYQLRKDQDSQAAQTRRPWPPSWPRREISASTGPCTASPRSRSGGWRPIMRPSRNPRGQPQAGTWRPCSGEGWASREAWPPPICEFCGHLVDLALQTIYTNYKCSNMQRE